MIKRILTSVFVVAIFASGAAPAFAATTKTTAKPLEKLFYYVPGVGSYVTLQQEVSHVDVFAPQVYNVDATGKLTGGISAIATAALAGQKTKIMPLVSQTNFDPTIMHTIITTPAIETAFINSLVAEALAKGYEGWQFDFEHMPATDRNAYSAFVEQAANELHGSHLLLSVAVIARTSENPSDLPAGSWDAWAGVFDYARIGKAADFVTLMAYDQPASTGPVASLPWVKKVLAYLEKYVPKSKISLGIPAYGWEWDTDTNTMVKSVGYDKVQQLEVNNLYTKEGYDNTSQTAWITFTQNGVNYKIWYEDLQTFKQKYALAKSQGLRGISVWSIGQEDERIWNNLN